MYRKSNESGFKRFKNSIRNALIFSAILSGLLAGSGTANGIWFENSNNPLICEKVFSNNKLNSFLKLADQLADHPVNHLEFLFHAASAEVQDLYKAVKKDSIAYGELMDVVQKLDDGRLRIGDRGVKRLTGLTPIYRVKIKHVRVYFVMEEDSDVFYFSRSRNPNNVFKVEIILTALATEKEACLKLIFDYYHSRNYDYR